MNSTDASVSLVRDRAARRTVEVCFCMTSAAVQLCQAARRSSAISIHQMSRRRRRQTTSGPA